MVNGKLFRKYQAEPVMKEKFLSSKLSGSNKTEQNISEE